MSRPGWWQLKYLAIITYHHLTHLYFGPQQPMEGHEGLKPYNYGET